MTTLIAVLAVVAVLWVMRFVYLMFAGNSKPSTSNPQVYNQYGDGSKGNRRLR